MNRIYTRIKLLHRIMRHRLNSNSPLSENQLLAIRIIKRAISDKRSTLVIAPISDTRYIHFNDIFIKIEMDIVTIINGSYLYHIQLPTNEVGKLLDKYNCHLEMIRKEWEAQMTVKAKNSLDKILNELSYAQ